MQDSPSAGASVAAPLTSRETRVLELIVEGKTNQEIADLLHRSIRTIEVHRSRVMKKLGAENPIDLLKRAAAIGLVDLPAKQEPN
ncbi:MAG: LuxR C-terminal-related transcriptional regulator [Planctomycetota bacterium]